MIYKDRLDEINQKLSRLKSGGGTSRSLVSVGQAQDYQSVVQKYEEILTLLQEIKHNSDTEIGEILGRPDEDADEKRVAKLLDNLIKEDTVATLNAIYHLYDRFSKVGLPIGQVRKLNKMVADTFEKKCAASQLIRLSDKTNLPPKKRQRLNKFAEIVRAVTPNNQSKRIPELLIIKNEIEGYINETANEAAAQKILSDNLSSNNQIKEFCLLQISDILDPPTIAENVQQKNATIYTLLDLVLEELLLLKSEYSLAQTQTSVTLKEMMQEIKGIKKINEKLFSELINQRYKNVDDNADNQSFEDILSELSELKEDIKSALTFDEQD